MAIDLSGLQAYQAASRAAQGGGAASNPVQSPGDMFGNMVSDAITDTTATLAHAEQMTAAGATGDAALVDVVTAVSAAEISLETVIAVRDEVVRAYQEILRMPI
ncbi:MAG: flagellar hook-basal body complex protein FliE [Maricaulis sp.]|jgi:flagellar hook-basal body complex protein FliE|nr:flagellar hook-basal body complex protein FliE [Maricaulis sp.]MDG2044539.1 flagellar hook-basal body complex protein FliE [Maricaulis sp.]